MFTKDIVDNAVNSADHTTLVAAVKVAGLVDTLKSPGPFTVFGQTNEAFDKRPTATVETLVKPENRETLTKILTYHVVPGRLSIAGLRKQIKAGGGKGELKAVQGETLAVMMDGAKITLKDQEGGIAAITIPNVFPCSGVIQWWIRCFNRTDK